MKKFIYTLMFLSGITIGVNAQTKKDSKPVASPKSGAVAKPAEKPAEKPKAAAPAESNSLTAGTPDKGKLTEEDIARIWSEYATPGIYHEQLASMVGSWNETVKIYPAPGAEPMVNKAICTVEMIFEGRYQQAQHKGDFNGVAFEGTSLVGYDNTLGKFFSTWIDNMGTGIIYTVGTYDEKSGKTTYLGEQVDPVTKKVMKIREVNYQNDKGDHIMETYTTLAAGREYLSMEITMVRIK
jgi:hypothetical protein